MAGWRHGRHHTGAVIVGGHPWRDRDGQVIARHRVGGVGHRELRAVRPDRRRLRGHLQRDPKRARGAGDGDARRRSGRGRASCASDGNRESRSGAARHRAIGLRRRDSERHRYRTHMWFYSFIGRSQRCCGIDPNDPSCSPEMKYSTTTRGRHPTSSQPCSVGIELPNRLAHRVHSTAWVLGLRQMRLVGHLSLCPPHERRSLPATSRPPDHARRAARRFAENAAGLHCFQMEWTPRCRYASRRRSSVLPYRGAR